MDAMTTDFWEVLLWSFWFFIWIAALTFWFRCLFDMFSDSSLSGWAKAGWAIFMIFIPWVGALVYLIVRGRTMSDRQAAAHPEPAGRAGAVHQADRRQLGRPRHAHLRRQGPARLRCDHRGRVQHPEGEGAGRLTSATGRLSPGGRGWSLIRRG